MSISSSSSNTNSKMMTMFRGSQTSVESSHIGKQSRKLNVSSSSSSSSSYPPIVQSANNTLSASKRDAGYFNRLLQQSHPLLRYEHGRLVILFNDYSRRIGVEEGCSSIPTIKPPNNQTTVMTARGGGDGSLTSYTSSITNTKPSVSRSEEVLGSTINEAASVDPHHPIMRAIEDNKHLFALRHLRHSTSRKEEYFTGELWILEKLNKAGKKFTVLGYAIFKVATFSISE